MASYDYDVIFIGSGHATWHGAVALVAAGKRVALVEEGVAGGTCTNFGCNAKYLLDTPFDFIDGLENYRGLGVNELPAIDYRALAAYKKANIGPMHLGLEGIIAQAGVDMLRGHGSLADAHTVVVAGDDGERRVTTEFVVFGTGEHPRRADIPGKELLHDSKDFLDLDDMPGSLAVIGAGIVGMEFASIALKMGAKTTVVEFTDTVLRPYPQAYVATLKAKMEAEGCTFMMGQAVAKAEAAADGGVLLTMASGETLVADYVVEATGRVPNVEDLGLAEVGIEYSARGIKVDDHLRTSVPNVFATGDCVDKRIPKLTPTAEFESNYVAGVILGNPDPIDYPVVPNLVFTLPRISQCGVTVAEAEAAPKRYRVARVPYGQALTFMAKSDKASDFTFIVDEEGCLVGCAIYGVDAGELINVAAMVCNLRLTVADLGRMIFSFPGTTYGFVSMMMGAMRG